MFSQPFSHQSLVRSIDVRDRHQHERDQESQHQHLCEMKTKVIRSEETRGSDRNDAARYQNRSEDFRKVAGLHSPKTPVLSQSSQFLGEWQYG